MLHVHWETSVLSKNDEANNCNNYRIWVSNDLMQIMIRSKSWGPINILAFAIVWIWGVERAVGWKAFRLLAQSDESKVLNWLPGFALFKAPDTTKGKWIWILVWKKISSRWRREKGALLETSTH